jgi:hypothetical protein
MLLDHKDSSSPIIRGRSHGLQQAIDDEGGKSEREFIGQQQSRLTRESPTQSQQLLLSSGE